MDYLKGYIGLSSSVSISASGLYVDALPDISVLIGDKISVSKPAETSEETLDRVWSNIEDRAILKFRTLFFRQLNKCFKVSNQDAIDCLICENKEILSVSFWYLLGSEFMLERTSSSRINRFTTVDKTKAKELRGELMELFDAELEMSVQGIDIENSDCFDLAPPHNNVITTYTPIL